MRKFHMKESFLKIDRCTGEIAQDGVLSTKLRIGSKGPELVGGPGPGVDT